MIIKSVDLETVCGITSILPDNTLPEIAIAGKSNVGKSSLINGLMYRKSYARISSKPGKTQTINYYNINKEFYLVDLPGYGYATADVKIKAQWGKLIEDYLHQSKKIELVLLLVDSRHEPSENDTIMYDWICTRGYVPVIIATKADKLSVNETKKQRELICGKLNIADERNVIFYSALTQSGREDIYDRIADSAGVENIRCQQTEDGGSPIEMRDAVAGNVKEKERWRKTGRLKKKTGSGKVK